MYSGEDFDPDSPNTMFDQGMDLLESNHFDEALEAFDQVLDEEPFHTDALFQRGVVLVNLGRIEDAVLAFRKVLSQAPGEGEYHSHLAFALMISGEHEEALQHFDEALSLQPHNVANKVYKACILAEAKRLGEARTILEEVVENHPDEADAIRHYAMVLTALGETEQALKQWERLLKDDPNHTEALFRRAMIHISHGERDRGLRGLREYLALQPQDLPAWLSLLELLTENDQAEAIIAAASEAIEAGHENSVIYHVRGREYLRARRIEQAITDLKRARVLDDRDPDNHFLLAKAYLEKGRAKHALISVNRCLQLVPQERAALVLKSHVHHVLGDYRTELELLNELLKDSPEDWRMARQKAEALLALDNPQEACRVVDDFLSHVGNHRRALQMAAMLREQCGRMAEARQAYEALLKHKPISSRTYQRFAHHLINCGETTSAAQTLHQGCLAYPEDVALTSLRAMVLQRLEDHQTVVDFLSQFFQIHPGCPAEIHWLLGVSLYSLGRPHEAVIEFQVARRKGLVTAHGAGTGLGIPGYHCLLAEAQALHHLQRTAEAVRLLERSQDAFHGDGIRLYLFALGKLYYNSGGLAKAESLFSDGCRLFPEDPDLHFAAAQVRAQRRQKAEAVHSLQIALRLKPDWVARVRLDPAFRSLGWNLDYNRLVKWEPILTKSLHLAVYAMWIMTALVVAWLVFRA